MYTIKIYYMFGPKLDYTKIVIVYLKQKAFILTKA